MNPKRAKIRKVVGLYTIGAISLLGIGVYLLVLTISPVLTTMPIVRDAQQKQVEEKLKNPPQQENKIYIPKIGVDIEIVTGADESALLRGAWHRKPENGNPRDGGNFVLSAHRFQLGYTPQGTIRKSPFYHIDQLAIDDHIAIDYEGKRYDYVVRRKYQVDPYRVSIEQRTVEPTLTLYSCTLRGAAASRDVIEATPITLQ